MNVKLISQLLFFEQGYLANLEGCIELELSVPVLNFLLEESMSKNFDLGLRSHSMSKIGQLFVYFSKIVSYTI